MSLIASCKVLEAIHRSEAVTPYREALAHDVRPHLTGRLRRRLRFLMVIGSLLLLIAAYDVIVHPLALFLALPAAAVGLGIGLMMGRISLFSWDSEERKVKARMDAVGVALLILYIVIISSRREILGQWVAGDMLAATSVAMTGATLMGRNFSMRRGIHEALMTAGLAPRSTRGSSAGALRES